jgi:hypothetical protein
MIGIHSKVTRSLVIEKILRVPRAGYFFCGSTTFPRVDATVKFPRWLSPERHCVTA